MSVTINGIYNFSRIYLKIEDEDLRELEKGGKIADQRLEKLKARVKEDARQQEIERIKTSLPQSRSNTLTNLVFESQTSDEKERLYEKLAKIREDALKYEIDHE